jgi:hypothetical protein
LPAAIAGALNARNRIAMKRCLRLEIEIMSMLLVRSIRDLRAMKTSHGSGSVLDHCMIIA